MISRKQKMQRTSENCSLGLIQTVHWQLWKVQRPLAPALVVFKFPIHRITWDDPERPEIVDNCIKDKVRGYLFTAATQALNACYSIYK